MSLYLDGDYGQEPLEDNEGEFFIGTEEIVAVITRCSECKCTHGIHLVYCSHFICRNCGNMGKSPDHHGGCPRKS